MYELRTRYPVLNDGFNLQKLSNQTHNVFLPGSYGTATERGLWSAFRSAWPKVQDLSGQGAGNQPVWLLYHNEFDDIQYAADCGSPDLGIIAPFNEGTTVKNLFYPYDEYTLDIAPNTYAIGLNESGCVSNIEMKPLEFKAFVPAAAWKRPSPIITGFSPGHDARILSNSTNGEKEDITITISYSDEMKCDDLVDGFSMNSTTEDGSTASLDESSVKCSVVPAMTSELKYIGQRPTTWTFTAKLTGLSNGVHQINLKNASAQSGDAFTNSVDHFLLRIGKVDNPIVFPRSGNYSSSLLHQGDDDALYVNHKAAGADMFRYSLNWGSSWSDWMAYKGGNYTMAPQAWTGTEKQKWKGNHVSVQYWSQLAGSSDHEQQGDLSNPDAKGDGVPPRRYPHFFIQGEFNEFGYDQGVPAVMQQDEKGIWQYDYVNEYPSKFMTNVWGMNANGKRDLTRAFGDVDNDTVLDLLNPVTSSDNTIHIMTYPGKGHIAFRFSLNDGSLRYILTPIGSGAIQALLFVLLALIPLITGVAGVWIYLRVFYGVKFNQVGLNVKRGMLPTALRQKLHLDYTAVEKAMPSPAVNSAGLPSGGLLVANHPNSSQVAFTMPRRSVLIATMEYYIKDWDITVKIGGLGVMAALMAKNLDEQDLIWVVPCLGGIDYPVDERGEPMHITIFNAEYMVEVQYHQVENITYILLDAPVFRNQTKAEPYPQRMDDFDSAIYYSAWNACIAEAMRRFDIDIYHINDYHGAIAPLYLLPRIIPCCLSLHNAEFQGLWPIRTPQELSEICGVYNLDAAIVKKYVQFGEVFNLLHAAASYLRIHQKGMAFKTSFNSFFKICSFL